MNNKKILQNLLLSGILAIAPLVFLGRANAQSPVRIAVADFKSTASNCAWCNSVSMQANLANLLSSQLTALGTFQVLDRKNLQPVLSEQELAALGLTPQNTAPQKGKFIGAKYIVLGSIIDYQEQTGRGQQNNNQCFFGVCTSKARDVAEAYVSVELRVVDAETAQVVHAHIVEGRSSSEVETQGNSFNIFGVQSQQSQTVANSIPTSKAVQAAMAQAVDYLSCVMVKQDTCLAKFDPATPDQQSETGLDRIRNQLNIDQAKPPKSKDSH
jgi:curli biogenesis system outer membrane secretion channel CsgG